MKSVKPVEPAEDSITSNSECTDPEYERIEVSAKYALSVVKNLPEDEIPITMAHIGMSDVARMVTYRMMRGEPYRDLILNSIRPLDNPD